MDKSAYSMDEKTITRYCDAEKLVVNNTLDLNPILYHLFSLFAFSSPVYLTAQNQ